jgi:hypothetical protein|tara:strand:+ start:1369 stop:1722 length:354 start_codon:yes stop_codon:yes gene_type:complete
MYNNTRNKNEPSWKGVFTMGPISVNQFNAFAKYGVNALRLFQYIRTKQGLARDYKGKVNSPIGFVRMDNQTLYKWFGVNRSKKWLLIKKLEADGLLEVRRNGSGKAPFVKILVPKLH